MKSKVGLYTTIAIVGAISALGPMLATAASQVPPSAPVTVVNTPANPVPVTGTIGLSGNANVTVTNTGSNPLPVVTLNQDDSVLNAFQTRVLFGGGNPVTESQFAVPAGKRLVIQSITAEVDLAPGQRPELFMRLTVGGKVSIHYLPLTFAGNNQVAGGRDVYMALHATRFFADGGTTVDFISRSFSAGPNTTAADISVSGYFVDTN